MKVFKRHTIASLAILAMLIFAACGGDDEPGSISIAPFQIIDDNTIRLHGEIDSNFEDAFDEVMRQNPNTELLIFGTAPGSSDDEINLRVGRKVYQLALNTHVEDNGEISSGAVDLFLAGTRRTLGNNVFVGVHSWSDGEVEASDLPMNHPDHQFYISYFQDIGFSAQWASDFYFFTINAAPADDIHQMTPAEIETWGLTTD